MFSEIDFQTLRDQWALKAPLPDKETILVYLKIDQQANPHNEPYHNKKPRRTEAETTSDLAYTYADQILAQQYGQGYKNWLTSNKYREVWGCCMSTDLTSDTPPFNEEELGKGLVSLGVHLH